MRAVSFALAAVLAACPAAAEHAFPEALASAYLTNIQQQLAKRGYYHGPVTGAENTATAAAIRAFQTDAGLPITGLADPALANALNFGPPVTAAPKAVASAAPARPKTPPVSEADSRLAPPLPPAPQPEVRVEPLPPAGDTVADKENAPDLAEAFDI